MSEQYLKQITDGIFAIGLVISLFCGWVAVLIAVITAKVIRIHRIIERPTK